jgi:hypothetical protein
MDGTNSLGDVRSTARGKSKPDVEVLELRCECGRRACRESLRVSLPTLEWARSRGLALLADGHEAPGDPVLERTSSFVLVRTRAGPGSRR